MQSYYQFYLRLAWVMGVRNIAAMFPSRKLGLAMMIVIIIIIIIIIIICFFLIIININFTFLSDF